MKEWDLCKCFCAFNTVLFKQKLSQQILGNKQAPLIKGAGLQWFSSNKHTRIFLESTTDRLL